MARADDPVRRGVVLVIQPDPDHAGYPWPVHDECRRIQIATEGTALLRRRDDFHVLDESAGQPGLPHSQLVVDDLHLGPPQPQRQGHGEREQNDVRQPGTNTRVAHVHFGREDSRGDQGKRPRPPRGVQPFPEGHGPPTGGQVGRASHFCAFRHAYRVVSHPVSNVQVLLTRLDPGVPIPGYARPGDAGADLVTTTDVRLQPGERALVGTGIALALPEGYAGFIHPRSGLAAASGLSVVNAPGTVDSGYRGEIKVCLINQDPAEPLSLRRGDRIAQLVVQRVEHAVFHEVDELPESHRGDGGYGSTGGHETLRARAGSGAEHRMEV